MNAIPVKQNEAQNLSLLRARQRLYCTAKRNQGAVVLVTLLLPVVSLTVAALAPDAKAYVALAALVFGICEVVLLDRWNKAMMKGAAKLQEEFDCDVLQMRPNEFLVGAAVDPEEVYALSARPFAEEQERKLRDWYPVAFGSVPAHVGRILCQRENLLYDGNVRKTYGQLLGACLGIFGSVLIVYSIAAHLTVDAFILTVLAPAMPAISWALREFLRQRDTVKALERLKQESEKLWRLAVDGLSSDDAEMRSRELQDAIYNHRVASPLVFDFLYDWRRSGLEAQMNAGAERLVREFSKTNSIAA
jgi:hypothetical protein